MRLIVFTCSIIILVMISMGATCRSCMEGFSSDTVLDWIRKGILKLRVVPDMIYGGSVDVGTVPVEKSYGVQCLRKERTVVHLYQRYA
jgi:hypothetical protein